MFEDIMGLLVNMLFYLLLVASVLVRWLDAYCEELVNDYNNLASKYSESLSDSKEIANEYKKLRGNYNGLVDDYNKLKHYYQIAYDMLQQRNQYGEGDEWKRLLEKPDENKENDNAE